LKIYYFGFFIFAFYVFNSYGEEADKAKAKPKAKAKKKKIVEREFRISGKYFNGRYLIYDCQQRHFACVNQESFKFCKKKREFDLEKESYFLRCTPLKEFTNQKSCETEQYKQVHVPKTIPFCLNQK
jgi:hypothetical protein